MQKNKQTKSTVNIFQLVFRVQVINGLIIQARTLAKFSFITLKNV